MNDIIQAIVLGAVQGLSEFLPISSSAHLVLFPWLLGWQDAGLRFDVALHAGTLIALAVYFFRDWLAIIGAALGRKTGRPKRLLWLLLLGAVPGAIVGVLLESAAEGAFRSPLLIAVTLALGGLVLLLADRVKRHSKTTDKLSVGETLLVGSAQALAIIPGFSRSAMTISAARALGYSRPEAARLSFLFAAPISAGAALFALRDLGASDLTPAFFIGIAAAAISGWLAISFLIKYVSRESYRPFVWYRVGLAALVVAVYFFR